MAAALVTSIALRRLRGAAGRTRGGAARWLRTGRFATEARRRDAGRDMSWRAS